MDCFCRTLINACLTIHTEIWVNNRHIVFHMNGLRRTDIHTGFTTGAFLRVNNCRQYHTSRKKFAVKIHKISYFGPAESVLYGGEHSLALHEKSVNGRVHRPRTSPIEYIPGSLPVTHRAARSAPFPKTARS